MSAPEVSAPVVSELTEAPVVSVEPTPVAEDASSAPTDQVTPTDQPSAETEAATPLAADESKAAEPGKSEEKKEKKQGRKPFAELLNKILKPHPQEKSTLEKKTETEGIPAVEDIASEAVAPAAEALVVEPQAAVEATETVATADASAEPAPVEDANKDVTTPRKERGNILEKITAFVMKPKSPKPKKSESSKENAEEVKPEAALPEATPSEAQPVEDVAPASPTIPTPEVTETAATEAATQAPDEVKVEKKEKSPKDLAKLARRFSGRLFGVEKKKDASKKPEPTQEEAEAAAQVASPAETAAASDAPQIPAETTPEITQSTAEPTPVIAATA